MQTFMPYPSFEKSSACLDIRRLGKQRIECLQILTALSDPSYGWQFHPAVKMWRGHTNALVEYGRVICTRWIQFDFADTCLRKIGAFFDWHKSYTYPPWLGNKAFHAAHRSNLLRKDPKHYGQFKWVEPNNLPYVWPVVIIK